MRANLRDGGLGVEMGPFMTEEQFAQYRAARGGRVHVIRK